MTLPPEVAPLQMRADTALAQGRFDDAISCYVELLADRAGLPDAWFNLAWAQRAMRQFDDAMLSYDQALARGIDAPEEAHLNRAAILSDHLFRGEEAVAELRTAIAHNPHFMPAWLSLGVLHEDIGDGGAARIAYDEVLTLDPGNGRALARLAALDTAAGRSEQAASSIEDALAAASPSIARADRSELLFALGNAYDAVGRYDEAFSAIDEANRIARDSATKRYDAAAQEQLVDRLIAAFPVARAHRTPPAIDKDSTAPVFVCGMFRSGSTLAEHILGRHPMIEPGGELEFMPALALALPPYPESIAALDADRIAALRRDYLAALPGSGLVTDKRCDNFVHIGLILTLFPDARILHTRRHALDNLLSVYFLPFGAGVSYDTDLDDAVHFYLQYRRLMSHWRAVFPNAIHDIDYDRLVADPQSEIDAAFDYLGVPRHDDRLDAAPTETTVRTASGWQVRQPLHLRSSGRWRHYRRALSNVAARIDDAGYGPVSPP